MNFSKIRRNGSRWNSIGGSDEKGSVVWATFRSKAKAMQHAQELARVSKGEYRGETQ